jgi:ABC-type sugar transport system ATPase subunit
MPGAVFAHVTKSFGEVTALADFNLEVADGELVTVLGPSGCGKSTLLRITAGLETPSGGTIHVGGRRIDQLAPGERDVAMVFQSYALYPHLTARANIEFPLRMRRVPTAERRKQVDEVAGLLELGELLERRPAELSGGQRQRVALARALVRRPALFLLDEPLSNVDARLRTALRHYIRTLQRRLGVTTLYVTHEQSEAMTLGDRMVVMHAGRLQQVDTPDAVYSEPANRFVAGFVGTPPMNLLEASVVGGLLVIDDQQVALPPALRDRVGRSDKVTVGIRPESFGAGTMDGRDGVTAVLDPASRELLGSETIARGRVGAREVTVRLPGLARELPPRLAAAVDAFHLFSAETGTRL